MRSPFPGMDPYLEMHWEDVHTRLIGYIADELQPQLSGDLIARMEEHVYVEDESEVRLRRPDIRVVAMPSMWEPEAGTIRTAVLDEPMLLEPKGDPIRERSVLIYDAAGNRIVTAIEVLSPWNKAPGKAVQAYLDKRKKYVNSETNLIEIDLVRTGDWTEMVGPFHVPPKGRTPYRVTVVSAEDERLALYPIPLKTKLPTIKVPLRPKDPLATLNLQGLIEKAYAMGRYDRINYSEPCKPPLEGADKDWANALVAGSAEK